MVISGIFLRSSRPFRVGAWAAGGLSLGGLGKAGRQAVRMHRDQRGGARLVLSAHDLQHPAGLGPIAAWPAGKFGQNQVAVLEIALARLVFGDGQDVLGLAVHRLDADFAAGLADDAENAVGALSQFLDQSSLGLVADALEADQQAITEAGRAGGFFVAVRGQARQRRVGAGLDQADIEVAVGITLDDVGHAGGRQGAGLGEALAAPLADAALAFEVADHVAQRPAFGPFQAKGAGNVGFLSLSGIAEEADEFVSCRQALWPAVSVFCHWP
jgi:hypothetical protein